MKTKTLLIVTTLICLVAFGSCKKKIEGCTNDFALNFNADADKDDGSCITIGSAYQGGTLAYILQQGDAGYDANTKHGLIAASSDQGTATWGCPGVDISGTSTSFGSGQANTTIIVNACSGSHAASICNNLVMGGFDDWYLPSSDELKKIQVYENSIGGFATGMYWTSSQYSGNPSISACLVVFHGGGTYICDAKDVPYYVRAIRSF